MFIVKYLRSRSLTFWSLSCGARCNLSQGAISQQPTAWPQVSTTVHHILCSSLSITMCWNCLSKTPEQSTRAPVFLKDPILHHINPFRFKLQLLEGDRWMSLQAACILSVCPSVRHRSVWVDISEHCSSPITIIYLNCLQCIKKCPSRTAPRQGQNLVLLPHPSRCSPILKSFWRKLFVLRLSWKRMICQHFEYLRI